MSHKIITISREFGSGGRDIGELVAKKLNVSCYDKELIKEVAKESGYSLDYIEENENATSSLLYNIATTGGYGVSVYNQDHMSPVDQVYIMQSKIIAELANRESCVIVGRCADYILREKEECLHVLIHADMEHKKERAIHSYGVSAKDAEKIIHKRNKARASHYKYYTGLTWGSVQNYHISLNSGLLGISDCVEIIANAAIKKLGNFD